MAISKRGNQGDDIHVYSVENVLRQAASAPETLGFYELRFYSDGKRPCRFATGVLDTFYYFPSGGTLRDAEMNIIFYEPRLDRYHVSMEVSDKHGLKSGRRFR